MTNEVKLAGRISRAPSTRELPSGDPLVSFRIVVPRAPSVRARKDVAARRTTSDWVDCVVWSGKLRRQVLAWQEGDQVEVGGSLRRRVYRAGSGAVALVEVEVASARRVRTSGPA